MQNPGVEWEQFESSDLWEADVRRRGSRYSLGVTTDPDGLHPGGRWYWSITEHGYPHGWSRDSGRGFRSKKAAMRDAEKYLDERVSNPMAGMPGGSVKGCIKKMKKRKKPPRDPGAYCASIADSIEPGWRENPAPGGVTVVPYNRASVRALTSLAKDHGFAVAKVTRTPGGDRFTEKAYWVVPPGDDDVVFWLGEYGFEGAWNEDESPWWHEITLEDPTAHTISAYEAGLIEEDPVINPRLLEVR